MISAKTVTGLYIGDNSVECAVLKGTLKAPKLIKFGRTHIYPEGGPEKDKEKTSKDHYIVDAVRRVFKENNIKPLNVVFGLSSGDAMVRYFKMPKIPKNEWDSAVNFEAGRYIPLPMEQVTSDFQVFQASSSSEDMDVVFTAARENLIARFINLLGKAGVKPIIVEPAPFSLMRVFNASGQINASANTSIVNIDAKTVTIAILRKGMPYIVRDISLEEDTSLDKSLPKAAFEKIISDIKLSFDFYKKQFPSETIDKIIVDSVRPIENLHEIIEEELGITAEPGDPLKAIKTEEGMAPPMLSIAFGLALRGLSKSSLDLSLCAGGLLDYRQKEQFLKILYLEASVAVILLIILKVVCVKALGPLTSELNLTLSTRPKPRKEINIKTDSIGRLEKAGLDIEKKIDILENILSQRTYVTSRLDELARLTPDNLWLTELAFEEKLDVKDPLKMIRHLSINGYCVPDMHLSERDIVREFLADLEESTAINNGMKEAKIVSLEKDEFKGEKVASFKILFEGQ